MPNVVICNTSPLQYLYQLGYLELLLHFYQQVRIAPAVIRELLAHHAQRYPVCDGMEIQELYDTEHDHYQVLLLGWEDLHRVYQCLLHIDVKDGKIRIQEDRTESGVANELVALGVPKYDIVLAFHAPYKRPYTGFAAESS
ncbi:XisI protein [Candidatus Entotheonella palauensis]|uniref:XisI protein n=1 Tax=Candidatus Entotheonella gemina TaxID=1429439 RepID=W4MFF7_9BACT|nr:XisI protein [Candidatus Entotheonella palauensis]ETX08905.1 MAG: hypothetical protein ETSY2_02645 [Candidatus Entotheonella gemina]